MSYTSITGMRSNRYPLMGSGDGLEGCGCGSCGGCGSMGESTSGSDSGVADLLAISVMGATAVGILFYYGRKAVQENRPRRRRRRTSRRR